MQYDNEALRDRLRNFVVATDFEAIYQEVLRLRDALGVATHCTLVRKTSAEAALEFKGRGVKFGLIHIDGNHDAAHVLEDVNLYLPLVKSGGLIVMDDVSWASVRPAVEAVASQTTLLFYESAPTVTELDYAIFRKGGLPLRSRSLRRSLKILRASSAR